VSNKELKYFYEKLLQASGVPIKHFGVKHIIRMHKIKKIYGIERNSTDI
jgi:hypothetical protein